MTKLKWNLKCPYHLGFDMLDSAWRHSQWLTKCLAAPAAIATCMARSPVFNKAQLNEVYLCFTGH